MISRLTNEELRALSTEDSVNISQLTSMIKELFEAREMLSRKKCEMCNKSDWVTYKDDYCMTCRDLLKYGGSEG